MELRNNSKWKSISEVKTKQEGKQKWKKNTHNALWQGSAN